MGNRPVSYEEVVRAAKELVKEGRYPSVAAIREKLGRGSNTTIHKHLREWWASDEAASLAKKLAGPTARALEDQVARVALDSIRKTMEDISRLQKNPVLGSAFRNLQNLQKEMFDSPAAAIFRKVSEDIQNTFGPGGTLQAVLQKGVVDNPTVETSSKLMESLGQMQKFNSLLQEAARHAKKLAEIAETLPKLQKNLGLDESALESLRKASEGARAIQQGLGAWEVVRISEPPNVIPPQESLLAQRVAKLEKSIRKLEQALESKE